MQMAGISIGLKEGVHVAEDAQEYEIVSREVYRIRDSLQASHLF